jgi:hypothetical protein
MKLFLIFLLSAIILCSCNFEKKQQNTSVYSNFKLEIDTILVDSRNEILMAGAYIHNPAISADNKIFYNWDRKNYALEVIDIEKYELKEKIFFEREGPKGLNSAHLFFTKSLPNNRFGFEDNYSYKIHDFQGSLFKKVNFDEKWITKGFDESENFELVNVNDQGNILAGIHFGIDKYKAIMYLLDTESEEKSSVALSKFQKLENYKLVLHQNETYLTSVNPEIYIDFHGDSLIISNNHFNDTYTYKMGRLNYKSYKHKQIPEGKEENYKIRSESREEVVKTVFEMNKEISFSKFLWDKKNLRFYRFAHQAFYTEENSEPKFKVYMMVYNPELKLIGELKVMTFDNFPEPLFVKDGKVHFHLNIEDELGFIRIGLK